MSEREAIISGITDALRDKAFALWEGGSASFDKLDEYSDIDLIAFVEDGGVPAAVQALEASIDIDAVFVLPAPTPHGYWQAWYRLKTDNPWLIVDMVIAERSQDWSFDEHEKHGDPKIIFDPEGIVRCDPMDPADIEKIKAESPAKLWAELDILHHLVDKELLRGKYPDALTFYWGIVLRKLVGLLRVKHCPARHEFGFRYVKTDLPPEVAERLERLMWVATPEELAQKKAEAISWAEELVRT